ncbi:hypothetical protein ACTI_17370 [Actinoplanes sp. OR16]|uniref:hypothetical protein n=1 Tax=Actinoplanes sp. OR16 TaxID=946334 RepID=UPI000F6DB2BF|nr:hypothetical protein [Actinoplanes sp. OR16]BBH65052.1 hypothetical protein ACTI_17370 [Actinoplanes sp. OR16]
MRKLWCAGAIAGGILLFGASPALADEQPLSPLNAVLGENPIPSDPLSGSPLIDGRILSVKPGSNGIGRTSGLTSPDHPTRPAGAARAEKQQPKVLPAADVVNGTLPAADPRDRTPGTMGRLPNPAPAAMAAGELAFSALPFDSLMNSGSTVITALGPDGLPVAQNNRIAGIDSRTEKAGTDVPLVGGIGTAGLGGAIPVGGVQQQLDGIGADVSGLPLGGSPVSLRPGRSARPATPDPDTTPPVTPGTVPAAGTPSSETPAGPTTPAVPATPGDSTTPSAPAASTGSPASAGGPASAADTDPADPDSAKPSTHHHSSAGSSAKTKSGSSGVAARDKIDDPRLLEEPTEGLN